jgi:hypothetical protein
MGTRDIVLLFTALTACEAKRGDDVDSATDSGERSAAASNDEDQAGPPDAPQRGTSAFAVTGGPYDVAIHVDGRVFCSVVDSRVVAWDGTEVVDVSDDLGPVHAIALVGDDLYFTTSLHQQAGSISVLRDGEVTVLATTHGDTLFREPVDLAQAPDGVWVAPDLTMNTVWTLTEDGTTGQLPPSSGAPRTVAFGGDTLYIGGEDGVWRMSWPDGTPSRIDERAANGLHVAQGTLWAVNQQDHLFEPGGERQFAISEAAVPGRITGTDTLYIADWALADVWAVEP